MINPRLIDSNAFTPYNRYTDFDIHSYFNQFKLIPSEAWPAESPAAHTTAADS